MSTSLEFRGIGKSYPGVRALDDISFKAEGGRVLALLGENGAGKSTLLKILSGDQRSSEGEILLNGEKISFADPQAAIAAGVSVIYQERQLVPAMTVMENIFPDAMPVKFGGLLDRRKLYDDAKAIIDVFGLPIDPAEQVGRLNVAYQQMVEIMKAYRRNSDVIAFDEPTAPLTDTEIDILFNIIKKLKAEGKTILYVSHRLSEIFKTADDIVVLKDGKLVTQFKVTETSETELIRAMVGRDIGDTYANLSRNDAFGDVVLDVKNLKTPYVRDVSFRIRKGEIVGLAGLVGAGRTEVARALFGADPVTGGEIVLDGESVSFKSPREAIKRGVALCPEDRKEEGLVMFRSIKDNVAMPVINKLCNLGFLRRSELTALADRAVKKYNLKTPSLDKITFELSGGNQQKVILGRWTGDRLNTKLLILDEPTKGIDVGTKAELYQTVCDLAKDGIAVLFISGELTEVINLADNIVVMHNGRVTGAVSRQEATEERVLALAMLE
ncbi:MAG: sugar ABC transporter ATP-binding protein [Clostridiales Family XIII bacterium]|jgi:ABC-type sugar transport system ATPase subunit|nr:sugar ABC transporter ATP-binding protein [Clostridiales Family XIII bacterium]